MQLHDPALALAHKKFNSGDIKGALTSLAQIIQANPEHRDARRMRALIAMNQNDMQAAIQDLVAILNVHTEDAESYNDLGVAARGIGDHINSAKFHLKSVELDPANENYMVNLAIALENLGQRQQVEQVCYNILQLNPRNGAVLTTLANIYQDKGEWQKAEAFLQEAVNVGYEDFQLLVSYGNFCRRQHRNEEAVHWYQRALKIDPNNEAVQFMMKTMTGENPDAPPESHVAGLFDDYADKFEQSLVGNLKYRTPQMLMTAMTPFLKTLDATKAKAIDLGAGTGLFGKLVRPYFKESIGLDLSQKMLDLAQKENIYDRVMCVDIVKGLEEFANGYFDLISSADVFVYVGNLDKIFEEAYRTLRQGGQFAYSTEARIDSEKGDFVLRDTGRYAHDGDYLKKLALKYGFKEIHFERDWIRYNQEVPLDGYVVVLEK